MLLASQVALADPLLQVTLFQHGRSTFVTSTPSSLQTSKANGHYRVCAVIPSSRDSYWSLVIEGLNYQAESVGIIVDVFETE